MKLFFGLLAIVAAAFVHSPISHAGVNDFTVQDFDIKYELGKTEDDVSTLRTVETITAEFPAYDQNHGIERALPMKYDGHPTGLKIESVTRKDGTPWNYSTRKNNDNEVLRIGDAETYVQGVQTYVITYSQKNVTRYFDTTGRDEFYWDTNGTEWKVPVAKLTVSLKVSEDLAGSLSGDNACYVGAAGSNKRCNIVTQNGMLVSEATGLSSGENMTLAVGFKKGTFTKYKESPAEFLARMYELARIVAIGVGGVACAIIVYLMLRWHYGWGKRGTIIPEYTPPRDASVVMAASVLMGPKSVFTAQLLDLAVRGYLKIYQTSEKATFKQADYQIEIVKDITDLKDEEKEILNDIFGGVVNVGSTLQLSSLRNSTAVANAVLDNTGKVNKLAREKYGLRYMNSGIRNSMLVAAAVLGLLALAFFNFVLLAGAILAVVAAFVIWPMTDAGLNLRRYAEGLKLYIKVAEVDRIRMLQSPEGAQKVAGVNVGDTAQLVKLYESVLPYAVLFGYEKKWNDQIGKYYESLNSTPAWYAGANAFNAATFTSGMNDLSSAASYTAASSSSSGGSSGGGSSGGGGGGGGGGGW